MSEATGRLENLRTLRYANLDAAFATGFVTLVGGTFLVGFVRHLGGSDLWIGLLTAVPSFLGLLQIFGAIWGRSVGSFKRFVTLGGALWRILHVPLIALPFVAIAGETRLWILFAFVSAAAACVHLVSPIYNEWLAELVPSDSRGWFFSRRNGIAAIAGAAAGIGGGIMLDAFRRHDEDKMGFAAVFALGLVSAAISMFFYGRMADIRRRQVAPINVVESLRQFRGPFQDANYRRLLVFFAVFISGQVFAGNLFAAFALETLRMPFTVLQGTAITHALGMVVGARAWGYLADRYGNKPVTAILAGLLFTTPAMWLFCYPGQPVANATILIAGHVFSGFVWGGVVVCQFNLLLAVSDPKDRANYIGVGLALQAVMGALAPMTGALLMHELRGLMSIEAAYKVVFGATMFLRFIAVFFLIPVREEGAVSIRQTLRKLGQVTPRGFAALRKLSTTADVATRESAMERVAGSHLELAVDELVKSLHDPTPRLRRQAAAALAKVGDADAVTSLVHMLEDHPDLVEEEMIEAIGELRYPQALPVLEKYLDSPRSMLRRAAARAIGRIGGPGAVDPLVRAAMNADDADLRRASLQALRVAGDERAAPAVIDGLTDPLPSVRVAAAEATAELGLRTAADALRTSLRTHRDEAAAEVAYALGVVGATEDIPELLRLAQECRSMITRRRALLGVARLLGVETEAYRLFLTEGLSRDSSLLELARTVRNSDGLREAFDLHAKGQGAEATERLAATYSELAPLAETPVDEGFLVAAAFAARRSTSRRAGFWGRM